MSNLAVEIKNLMKQHNLKARDISKKAGLYDSHVHRLLKGQQFVDAKTLEKLANVFQQREEKAAIIAAHCKDERGFSPGFELVDITVKNATTGKEHKAFRIPLELEKALLFLRSAAVGNDNLTSIIIELAKMNGMASKKP